MAQNIVQLGDGSKMVFDWSQFAQLRHEGQKLAMAAGEKLAEAANNYPYSAESKKYTVRAGRRPDRVTVLPVTQHARRSNAKHNTLVKLLSQVNL